MAITGLNEALDRIYAKADGTLRSVVGSRVRDIIIGSDQRELLDAIVADVVDIIPIVGDASNVMRIRDAASRGAEFAKRRLPTQVIDLVGGVLPDPIGGIFDMVTPTNTINYLERTGALKKGPKSRY